MYMYMSMYQGLCYGGMQGWDPDLPYDGDNLANCCVSTTTNDTHHNVIYMYF